MAQRPAVRWAAIAMAALLVVALVAGVAASIGGGSDQSASTTVPDATQITVPRDGDPAFCAAIVDLQDAIGATERPDPSATPAQNEASWDRLSDAGARLMESAPRDMAGIVQPVVAAFDQLRIEADALDYDYQSLDELPSNATIDPTAQIAQNAYTLLVYQDSRCPLDAGATTTTAG